MLWYKIEEIAEMIVNPVFYYDTVTFPNLSSGSSSRAVCHRQQTPQHTCPFKALQTHCAVLQSRS